MIPISKVATDNIGPESMYLQEKTGSAIWKEPGADTELVISLLKSYKERLLKLKTVIDSSSIYDNSYFDFEFKTMIFAIDKLILLIGNIKSEEDQLEASIYRSHLCEQDYSIRKALQEIEEG